MGTGKAGGAPARAVEASVAVRRSARTTSVPPELAAHMDVVAEKFLGEPNRPRLVVDNAPIRGVEAELVRARDAYDRARIARDQAKHVYDEAERSVFEALSGIARIMVRRGTCRPTRSTTRSGGG
jgi:hypothetical protein